MGRYNKAAELLEQALQRSQALWDQDGELRALAALLEAYFNCGTGEQAVVRTLELLARVEPLDVSSLTPARDSALSAVYFWLGGPMSCLLVTRTNYGLPSAQRNWPAPPEMRLGLSGRCIK
jgi:hypothetical protein